jgi:hypothetical protein
MVWLPPVSVAGEKVAVPAPDRLAVPNVVVPPSRNVTVPVGVPLACGVTVAVNVTVCPIGDGFIELDTAVDVAALFTVCVSAPEELELKFASPPYETVIEWLPNTVKLVETVAVPALDRLAVPNVVVPPSRKITVPVAVPDSCGATAAVKVTVWPNTEGFVELVTVVMLDALFTV